MMSRIRHLLSPRGIAWAGTALLLGLAVVLSGCAQQALAAPEAGAARVAAAAATPDTTRTASVTGVGKATLTPDMAIVRVGVRSEDPDVGRAVSENIHLAQAVYNAVKALGVEEKDLQTANFNVYKTTKGPEDNRQEVYVVENTVTITVRDLDDLGAIIAAALNAGANQVYGLSFGASDYQDALTEARRLALQDAQAQARLMAETLGVTLGPPRRVSFSGGGQPVARADVAYRAAPMMEAAAEVPVEAGELVVTAQAFVEFDLVVP